MNAEMQGYQLPQSWSGFLFAGSWVSTQMCGARRGGPLLDCHEESPKEIIQFPAVTHAAGTSGCCTTDERYQQTDSNS